MNFLVAAALKYLETHPEQVERLVEALVEAFIAHFKNPNPKP